MGLLNWVVNGDLFVVDEVVDDGNIDFVFLICSLLVFEFFVLMLEN